MGKNKQDPIKNTSVDTKISCINISSAYKISFIAYSAFSIPNKITSEDNDSNQQNNEFANLDNEVAQISEQVYADQSLKGQNNFNNSTKNQTEKEDSKEFKDLPKFSMRDSEVLSTRIRGNQETSVKKFEIQIEDFKATLNKIIFNGLVMNQVPSSSYVTN